MRRAAFVLVALLAVPLAAADTEQGATVGVNLGFVAPGLWDVFQLDTSGTGVSLAWAASLFPGADYDLRVYRGDALQDGALTPNEEVASSLTRTFAPHTEQVGVGAGRFLVAVCPFQAQGETYTLSAPSGELRFAAAAVGYEARR
jgi:hypothetical protein